MALKRPNEVMSMYSMASMTDVIFLLLIFFMVTSTFVFPTALEINLPQSSKQTALKPTTRVYIDRDQQLYLAFDSEEPQPVDTENLLNALTTRHGAEGSEEDFIAIHADEEVPYGKIVEVLDIGARNNLKMVLATRPAKSISVTESAATPAAQPAE
ncbi:MAG: biopolymer transporter ExbD [Muribaculaceae bacterium]|nr:biopolymer transporter ExbD [Muribaculaceae bacterium]